MWQHHMAKCHRVEFDFCDSTIVAMYGIVRYANSIVKSMCSITAPPDGTRRHCAQHRPVPCAVWTSLNTDWTSRHAQVTEHLCRGYRTKCVVEVRSLQWWEESTLPCYGVDVILPAGVVTDELDEQSGHNNVDWADGVTEHVQQDTTHRQSVMQICTGVIIHTINQSYLFVSCHRALNKIQ